MRTNCFLPSPISFLLRQARRWQRLAALNDQQEVVAVTTAFAQACADRHASALTESLQPILGESDSDRFFAALTLISDAERELGVNASRECMEELGRERERIREAWPLWNLPFCWRLSSPGNQI